jgi:hypothetical protein
MTSSPLREHDAQQGAQSKGEFLGMTGNSSWWLLGSAGMAVLMVTVLWGIFGVPLVACLVAGLGLCTSALLYVFFLKNDKPAHYDTDFFESVLIEAGAVELAFGPRSHRPENPFQEKSSGRQHTPEVAPARFEFGRGGSVPGRLVPPPTDPRQPGALEPAEQPRRREPKASAVPLPTFERIEEELHDAQERLEEALSESGENSYAN